MFMYIQNISVVLHISLSAEYTTCHEKSLEPLTTSSNIFTRFAFEIPELLEEMFHRFYMQ